MSGGIVAAVIFGIIFGIFALMALVWAFLWCHYSVQRRMNKTITDEAEKKLRKALNKVEEESSSFTKESQNIKQKLYNWE